MEIDVEVRDLGEGKGRALFALRDFAKGDVIIREFPLAAAQFSWNKTCKYRACDHCLKSIETATEMARRLSGIVDLELPHSEFQEVNAICSCPNCGAQYCSEACRDVGLAHYHRLLCTGGDPDHILNLIEESWKKIHHPPETTSISLILRIMATCLQAESDDEVSAFYDFCNVYARVAGDRILHHTLLSPKFQSQIEAMFSWISDFFRGLQLPTTPRIESWLNPDGFRSLLALLGTNASGIGTSSLAFFDKRLNAAPLDPVDREQSDTALDNLYEVMEEESGGFLDCEGSGLYRLQSTCNHSCLPNAECTFPENNFVLHLVAVSDITAGQEINISYIDEDLRRKSRNFRQQYLATNYLFECSCVKCTAQIDEPDLSDPSSEEEDDDDDQAEDEEEDAMSPAGRADGAAAGPVMRVIHNLEQDDDMIYDDADLEA